MRENEHLKEKLAQIEASSQICFHGKNLPPPSDQGNLLRGIANCLRKVVIGNVTCSGHNQARKSGENCYSFSIPLWFALRHHVLWKKCNHSSC